MTDKLFDSFIKSRLDQYDSGAPMHVWERIKKDKDDDPKGFFFWMWKNKYLLMAGLLIIAAASGYLFVNTSNRPSLAVQKNDGPNAPAGAVQNSVSELNTATTTPAVPSNTKLKEKAANPEPSVAVTQDAAPVSQSQRPIKQAILAAPPINGKSYSGKSKTTSKRILQANVNDHPLVDRNKNSLNDQVTVPSTSAEHTLSVTGYSEKSGRLPQLKLGNIALPLNKPSCPTVNGPRRRELFLEVYAGPDYNLRSLTSSAAPAVYVTERNANENYRTSFSAGVRVVKNIGEKSLIKTGINYSQINETLRIVTQNTKQLTQVITIRTVVRAPGDTLFVRDTMFYEQNGSRYRTTYNRYRFIDVPVIFSYEFGNPELMHFAVNAGPVFNVTSFYRGEVLDTSFKAVSINTNAGTNAYNWRNNIGIGVFASVSMYKRLNDRVHLFAEPYMRYNFNPVTQANNTIKQRYFITGMQLGIRYNLTAPGQRYR